VEKRTAASAVIERPTEGVLDQTTPVALRRDLPQFLEADAEFRRLAVTIKAEAGDQRLGQMAARAFGKQGIFAAQLHAARKRILWGAVAANAHVAGRNADNLAAVSEQHLGSGKARIDFDARSFRLCAKPPADVAERDNEIAVVVHQRRHQR